MASGECGLTESEGRSSMDEMEFPFPFPPYQIQIDFMKTLYRTLQDGKLGIFESPTGTGKSLSIICGTLTWLRDYEGQKRSTLEKSIAEAQKKIENDEKHEDEDWFEALIKKKKMSDKLMDFKQDFKKYELLDQTIKDLKANKAKAQAVIRKDDVDELLKDVKAVQRVAGLELSNEDHADDDFLINEYLSDEDHDNDEDKECNVEEEASNCITKIYYCSRTHSQLSQFINEVKKSPFKDDVRVVPLSSRQNLCINDSVLQLKSITSINNRCIELQKRSKGSETKISPSGEVLKKRKSAGRCPYFKHQGMEHMKGTILTNIKEIEELADLGRKSKTCPYYSSRYAVPLAQLVVVPYNILLHKSTREACGIDLTDNVVIIDEAHNLLDAICNIYSSLIFGNQLIGAFSQLSQYKDRYMSRLTASNLLHVNQLLFIIRALIKWLKENCKKQEETRILTTNELILNARIDNLDLFKILRFCKKSELSRKLLGFSEKYQPNVKKLGGDGKKVVSSLLKDLAWMNSQESKPALAYPLEQENVAASSPLMQIETFFHCLTNSDKNGRIVLNTQSSIENCSLKYTLLNPSSQFKDLVSKAKAVVVAGGTLQPISEFSEQLFCAAGASLNRVVHFSCGHVVPSSHLSVLALIEGPSGVQLDFSYHNRKSTTLMDELGRIILNLCNIVPAGMVCFFPSYEYESKVVAHWEETGILGKIDTKKKVFREPRNANQINQILSEFSKRILPSKADSEKKDNKSGGILFSIVGGKMSEGINFSDDLGRCIIVIGMPFANIQSVELKEKMTYLNNTLPKTTDGTLPGQIYYENICMKAVNQSIGRAIRHSRDFASILLLDRRYSRPTIQKALPGWICGQLKTSEKFGTAFASIRQFFKDKMC